MALDSVQLIVRINQAIDEWDRKTIEECLKEVLKDERLVFDLSASLVPLMVVKGRLDVLNIFKGYIVFSSDLTILAAANNHADILKWLHDNGSPFNKDTLVSAAIHGHMKSVKYLIENNCIIANDLVHETARANQVPILILFRNLGLDVSGAIAGAAHDNNIGLMKSLVSHGFPVTERAMKAAMNTCSMEAIKYLRKIKCPYNILDYNTCKHIKAKQYIHDNDDDLICNEYFNKYCDLCHNRKVKIVMKLSRKTGSHVDWLTEDLIESIIS